MSANNVTASPQLARHLRGRVTAVAAWISETVPRGIAAVAPQTTDAVIEELRAQDVADEVVAAALSQLRRQGYTFSTTAQSTRIGFKPIDPVKVSDDRARPSALSEAAETEASLAADQRVRFLQLEDTFRRAQRSGDFETMAQAAQDFHDALARLFDQPLNHLQDRAELAAATHRKCAQLQEDVRQLAPQLARIVPGFLLGPVDRAQLRERLPTRQRAQCRLFV
jgi:hypothetical protein